MTAVSSPTPLLASRSPGLSGRVRPPGDKSISHRALILGLLSIGETRISGLLEGDDIMRTLQAVLALGAGVTRQDDGLWHVRGVGIGGLVQPSAPLDFGNAGTGSRLMMGVAGSHPVTVTFDGDASLRKRPMRRILDPLALMGTRIVHQEEGGRLPVTLQGLEEMVPIRYETPIASAQIKSAVLLAGLNAPGETTVVERAASRDHTERMLTHFGASVTVTPFGAGGREILLKGQPELRGAPVSVPADPSSAAFPIVAALITPGSDIIVSGMMMNPLRIGLIHTLIDMGGRIEIFDVREDGHETVADLRVQSSALVGVDVPADRAPSMIDEYPVLAVAAAFAYGETRLRGLHELRVKESDRLAAVLKGLRSAGVEAQIEGDDLLVRGGGGRVEGGGFVATDLDHRIAMSFLVMGLASEHPMRIDDGTMIATSFPGFCEVMTALGASITEC